MVRKNHVMVTRVSIDDANINLDRGRTSCITPGWYFMQVSEATGSDVPVEGVQGPYLSEKAAWSAVHSLGYINA